MWSFFVPFSTPIWGRVGPSVISIEKGREGAADAQLTPEKEETPTRGSKKARMKMQHPIYF
jgi:hypothetical protein